MKKLVFFCLIATSALAQETCTLTGTGDIKNASMGSATWSCTGASANPIEMVANAGNQVIIPAGLELTISGNQTWESSVTLEEETSPGAADGGKIIFGKKLDLGTAPGCGYTFTMETGSNIDETGGGSDRLLICGQTIIGPNAGAVLDWPSGGGGFTGPLDIDETGGDLPIELVYFVGETTGRTISLAWATSSEDNFDYFEIQRSIDGFDFHILATQENQGGLDAFTEYQFMDESPFDRINYYRLKSVDYDGSFEYHPVISVDYSGKFSRKLLVYPNPATDQFTLRPNFDFEKARISIKDLEGKLIFSELQEYPSKTFNVPPSVGSGMYLIEFQSSEGSYLEKLILNR